MITNRLHVPLAVITADCFPVVLTIPSLPAAGILHAGRTGIAAQLMLTAITLVRRAFNVPPEAVLAAIGPGIGRCCYEVDDANAEPFLSQFGAHPGVCRPSRPGYWYLDLQQAIRLQLSAAGIPSTQIWFANLCTACPPQWFYSYRREGPQSGRMLNVVIIQDHAGPTCNFPFNTAPPPV